MTAIFRSSWSASARDRGTSPAAKASKPTRAMQRRQQPTATTRRKAVIMRHSGAVSERGGDIHGLYHGLTTRLLGNSGANRAGSAGSEPLCLVICPLPHVVRPPQGAPRARPRAAALRVRPPFGTSARRRRSPSAAAPPTSSGPCCSSAAMKPPRNASPAPVESTQGTGKRGRPDLVALAAREAAVRAERDARQRGPELARRAARGRVRSLTRPSTARGSPRTRSRCR